LAGVGSSEGVILGAIVHKRFKTDYLPSTSHLFKAFDDPKEYNDAVRGNHYLTKGIIMERLHEESAAPGKCLHKDKGYCGD
jgi:hypothetical protein